MSAAGGGRAIKSFWLLIRLTRATRFPGVPSAKKSTRSLSPVTWLDAGMRPHAVCLPLPDTGGRADSISLGGIHMTTDLIKQHEVTQ